MTMWIYIWLGVVAFSVMIEFLTMEQVSVWFIGGGIVAMILAAVNVDPVIQIVVFIVVSLVLLLSFRRMVMRFLMKNDNAKTNADALVGREYQLLEPLEFEKPSSVKINVVVWTAISENEKDSLAAGTLVRVVSVEGNKLIVRDVKED